MPIEVQQAAVGAHPDAAPDNAIHRNTQAICKLVQAVDGHNAEMVKMVAEVGEQLTAMAEHRQIITEHFAATEQSAETVAELVLEMRALNNAIPELITAITKHIPALLDNTAAINKFRL